MLTVCEVEKAGYKTKQNNSNCINSNVCTEGEKKQKIKSKDQKETSRY